jgi:hypothetical protein
MCLETKECNIEIKGKDGFVKTSSIQKHNPSRPMMLMSITDNHFIFCQDNHPLFINRNDEVLEIEASEIKMGDKIWVDDSIIYDNKECLNPSLSPNDVYEQIKSLENKNTDYIDENYIKGNILNYRLHPKFLSFDDSWLLTFMGLFDGKISTSSYNFFQQIVFISKKICANVKFLGYLDDKFVIDIAPDEFESMGFTNGYLPIESIQKIYTYKNPVFDIKTETKEFIMSSVQNHNSFHLGGAINLKPVDIINEIMINTDDSVLPTVKENIAQEKDTIMLKSDYAMIRIDKTLFEEVKYKRELTRIVLPTGYFELIVGSASLDVTIEYQTIVHLPADIEEDNRYIVLIYNKGDKMISVAPRAKDYTKLDRVMDALISGKSPYSSIPSLYIKYMKGLYVFEEPYDSVHVEVLLSNVLRDKTDPSKTARLKMPYDPTLISIKNLPSLISWPLGIAFENFGKAVSMGLISDRSPSSPIEKVMFGESLVEMPKPKRK